MNLFKTVKLYFKLTALLFVVSCSLIEQNDFVVSKTISNEKNEQIFYGVYKTGNDNYRFEFMATNNSYTNL